MATFGERLRQILNESGKKQSEVCEATGIGKGLFSHYLTGDYNAKSSRLHALAKYFNVSEAWLMGFDVPRERPGEDNTIPRGYEPMPEMKRVPLLGGIACGQPILAVEDHEEDVEMPKHVHADFALVCHGDSMKDARIYDGDVVYIRRQSHAENGDIVAAEIDGEATLKRFYRKPNGIMLMPANSEYEPIFIPAAEAENFHIDGVAVAFTSAVR